ncbi:Hcp family type VI secretion system effector [Metapseudomonas otitidis]|jgi:type VI secretion system secreted protein Hcp|uniref:Secreted protein Hcp n=3 Tax=Metapseudomonas otitidis TaxID=319939 RepID=A0A679GIE5_9GAMM|nr:MULTISPECIES: Hcp family type VI secretion system effector [Pseudomonas]MDL5600103.1 Hcp family type VI secretion system effector [Bacillus subtilis]KIV63357.1 Secreted protein Hcp [Pseudomonas sp. FeS53a]MBO2927100.1 Hcp family type VI secretion system effector [Pseudomonas otitidis]MCO7556002.1 Hcp family type VI secretion system effector [Pseudomonas otitidis]MCP1618900.1 type VI secretion system secreted protein Hcp [Pseudomonas otitidis]
MPTPAYLSLEGTKQGLITAGTFTEDSVGNIFQEGHEDQILVQAFNHQVIIPRDPQSGQPTGQRVHKPLMITKVFDKSSPLIFNALTSGERLSKCRLEWYRTSSTGTQEHYFTIELEDAVIVDVQSRMPNCQDPNMAHFTHLEDVYFTYRKIVWTHEVSGTSGSDDWRTPISA